jgi:hypothetical protein
MEHWVRLASSNAALYVAVFVFTFGLTIWLAWARFFLHSDLLKRVSYFVMALAGLIYFGAGYTHVIAKGLDGVVCMAGRYSLHATCFNRDESPVRFWAVTTALLFFSGVLLLAAVMCVTLVFSPVEGRSTAYDLAGSQAIRPGSDKTALGKLSRLCAFKVLTGMSVVLPLAWLAAAFHQVDGVRSQVAEALTSAAGRKAAVEEYFQKKGILPADNEALGLPMATDLRDRHISATEIIQGNIFLTFDDRSVDEHLRGRVVMLVAGRLDHAVVWHCANFNVDDRYLPRDCR